MAYFNQEMKKARAPRIKAICQKYGIKASLSIHNHSTFCLNIKSGKIDFFGNYNTTNENKPSAQPFYPAKDSMAVNDKWIHENYTGEALEFLTEIINVMNEGNFDKSDIMTDYFHVGWYIDVNIGSWDKPYILTP